MTSGFTRLHITPLTPDLLPIILGPIPTERAQNISYHEIQTFPERNYGYVDLPEMDAEKVKRKLTGATLKGKKIKIEEAKPKKREHEGTNESATAEPAKPGAKAIKRKKEQKDVLSGHELSQDRKIKRGWTESTNAKGERNSRSKSDQQKSKYTDKDELLFRTKLALNNSGAATVKKKKSTKNRDVEVVHEFEKSTVQPSFLKESGGGTQNSLQYVDGQGWVTEDGTVLEPEPSNVKAQRTSTRNKGKSKLNPPKLHQKDPVEEEQISEARREAKSDDDSTGTSSSDPPATPCSIDQQDRADADKSDVHPLEALFKKPKKPASSQDIVKPSLELTTSNFSFFDGGDVDDIEEELSVPGTPFSSQDIRSRGLRSAAPTPDTAHPSRFNSYGSSGLLGDERDESEEEINERPESSTQPRRSLQPPEKGQPSQFEKMFWEKRGDNNRAWKARRRAVLKDKRQRENRSRRPKNW